MKRLKEILLKLTLDLQDNINQDLKCIEKDLSELRANSKLEAELAVTKQVNVLCNRMVQIKRKSWSNEQYSRRECLEIVSIPESVTYSSVEETALNIFKELGFSIDTSDVKSCHQVGPQSRKEVIAKMSRQKDADRVWRVNPY